jgi:hypothetical protein
MSSSNSSYYFASHRNTSNTNSKEIDHLSPRQEKKLARKQSSSVKFAAATVESEPAVWEKIPVGSKPEEFYSRPVPKETNNGPPLLSAEERYESHQKDMIVPGYEDRPVGSLLLERKVPVKLEPKGFFAVERTFLLWMHSALWLLAASLAIIAYGYKDPQKLIYGMILLPVALAFLCYALYQCK